MGGIRGRDRTRGLWTLRSAIFSPPLLAPPLPPPRSLSFANLLDGLLPPPPPLPPDTHTHNPTSNIPLPNALYVTYRPPYSYQKTVSFFFIQDSDDAVWLVGLYGAGQSHLGSGGSGGKFGYKIDGNGLGGVYVNPPFWKFIWKCRR
jgi:hypothetical protein